MAFVEVKKRGRGVKARKGSFDPKLNIGGGPGGGGARLQ